MMSRTIRYSTALVGAALLAYTATETNDALNLLQVRSMAEVESQAAAEAEAEAQYYYGRPYMDHRGHFTKTTSTWNSNGAGAYATAGSSYDVPDLRPLLSGKY